MISSRKHTRCPVSNEKADLCERIPGNKCSTGESAGKISFAPVPVPVPVCQTTSPLSPIECQLVPVASALSSWGKLVRIKNPREGGFLA